MQAITTATTTLALAARRVISGSPATGLTVLAVVLAGCADTESTSPFSWLRPSAAPAGWRVARIATGALLHYPPGWRPAPGDAGTATAARSWAPHQRLPVRYAPPARGGPCNGRDRPRY